MTEYAQIYNTAERYFSWKRAQLTDLLRKQLIRDFAATASRRTLEIADFGAGDGRLILDIADGLPGQMKRNAHLTLVEPDGSFYRAMNETFNTASSPDLGPVSQYRMAMDEYLAADPSITLDAALMTHMLYHIPVEEWQEQIDMVMERLSTGGHAYITLVEEQGSDAYGIARNAMTQTHEATDAIGGGYIFASHLDDVLAGMKHINVITLPNPGHFNIPAAEIDDFIKIAEQEPERLREVPFVQFLGFILRREPEEIAANKQLIGGFIDHFKDQGALAAKDMVYRITPHM